MTREEITNSQDYKAEGVALDWYKSLSAESVGEIHITDAYADGVIYGWNNPQWIHVEEELPKEKGAYLFHFDDGQTRVEGYFPELHLSKCVTHWMPLPTPPVKKGGEQ